MLEFHSYLTNQVWLYRYPRPTRVHFDDYSEFENYVLPLLKGFVVKSKLTSIKNPQSNGIVERVLYGY